MSTVQIQCSVPQGVKLRIAGQEITISGNGDVTEIDGDLWARWLAQNAGSSVLSTLVDVTPAVAQPEAPQAQEVPPQI